MSSELRNWRLPTSIAAKWHRLMQRKLDEMVKQYHDGRWRRYYSEEEFLSQLRSTKRALDEWGKLLAENKMFDQSVEETPDEAARFPVVA